MVIYYRKDCITSQAIDDVYFLLSIAYQNLDLSYAPLN